MNHPVIRLAEQGSSVPYVACNWTESEADSHWWIAPVLDAPSTRALLCPSSDQQDYRLTFRPPRLRRILTALLTGLGDRTAPH
ncbi:hypothetical protein [Streptomyces sp. NPDC059262]|uniref:hypothetical protein n=1 Tax=Streptomyces sp. NPDC059262 TaxID=3346797 RepID=UPI0036ACB1B5